MRKLEGMINARALPTVADISAGTFDDSMKELMQNSRRAGATRIDIDVDFEKRIVTVTDDGHGIRNADTLLNYGLPNWEPWVSPERPMSGMGLFSLADQKVVIKTRCGSAADGFGPWQTTLEPKHFRNETCAARTKCSDAPRPRGTAVSIWADGVKTWALEQLARNFPIPVNVCGKAVEQLPPLDGANDVFEWKGLEIGLFDDHKQTETSSRLCWHGAMSNLAVKTTRGSGHAIVDVIDCPQLRMSRPGLDLMVDHPFSHQLTEVIERCLDARRGIRNRGR